MFWFAPENTEKVNINSSTQVKDGSGNVISSGNTTVRTSVYTGDRDTAYAQARSFLGDYAKRHTIMPGKSLNTFVVTRNTKSKVVDLEIALDGKVFVFQFKRDE